MVAVPGDTREMGAVEEGKGTEVMLLLTSEEQTRSNLKTSFYPFIPAQTELCLRVEIGLPPHTRQCGRHWSVEMGEVVRPFPRSRPSTAEPLMPRAALLALLCWRAQLQRSSSPVLPRLLWTAIPCLEKDFEKWKYSV